MPVSFGADIGGIISGMMQYKAQQEANQIAWQNLFDQRDWNNRILAMQKAGRQDAYGNEINYLEGLGWRSNPTPQTKSILDAEQAETRRQLTEDAPRNRAAAIRQDDRSKQGAELYEEAVNAYKSRPERREGAYIGDAVNELLEGRKRQSAEVANALGRQAMRTGGSPENVAKIFKQANESLGDSLAELMLKGRRLGKAEHRADVAADTDPPLRDIQLWGGVADNAGRSPVQYSNLGPDTSRKLEAALAELTAAMGGARGASADAYKALIAQIGNAPKFSGSVSGSFSGDKSDSGSERYRTYGDGWERIITRPYTGRANTGQF